MPALPKGEPRALGGRSEHLYRPTTFCPPTCLPLWGRWHGERRDGEGACVLHFMNAGKKRNVATLSVTGLSALCQLSQRESQVGRRKIGRAPKESAKGALRAPVCPSTLYHPLACPIGRAKSVGGGSGRGGRSSTYRLDFSAQPGYDSFKERSVKGGASYAR